VVVHSLDSGVHHPFPVRYQWWIYYEHYLNGTVGGIDDPISGFIVGIQRKASHVVFKSEAIVYESNIKYCNIEFSLRNILYYR